MKVHSVLYRKVEYIMSKLERRYRRRYCASHLHRRRPLGAIVISSGKTANRLVRHLIASRF